MSGCVSPGISGEDKQGPPSFDQGRGLRPHTLRRHGGPRWPHLTHCSIPWWHFKTLYDWPSRMSGALRSGKKPYPS